MSDFQRETAERILRERLGYDADDPEWLDHRDAMVEAMQAQQKWERERDEALARIGQLEDQIRQILPNVNHCGKCGRLWYPHGTGGGCPVCQRDEALTLLRKMAPALRSLLRRDGGKWAAINVPKDDGTGFDRFTREEVKAALALLAPAGGVTDDTGDRACDEIDRLRRLLTEATQEADYTEEDRLREQVQALQAERDDLLAGAHIRLQEANEEAERMRDRAHRHGERAVKAERLAEQRGAVLRQVEESAVFCPVCTRAPSLGHAPDCTWAAALPDTGQPGDPR